MLCLDCILEEHSHKEHRVVSLDQASSRYREKLSRCLDVIASEINLDSTFKQMNKRKDDLKKAATSAEQKLIKFSEYLISKVEKRRDLIRAQINKKLAMEMQTLLGHHSILESIVTQTKS